MKQKFIPLLRDYLGGENYRPQNKSELARALQVASKDRAEFRNAIVSLERNGEIIRGRKGRFELPGRSGRHETAIGRIERSPDRKRRLVHFVPDDPSSHQAFQGMQWPKAFVPSHSAGTALHDDLVEVELFRREPPRWHEHANRNRQGKKFEGDSWQAKVIRIVKRSEQGIVGTFHGKGSRASLSPDDRRMPPSFQLISVLPEANPGDIVVARFHDWTDPGLMPMAEMVKVLGREDAPGVDILKVVHRYGLPVEFPPSVIAEAEMIDEVVSPAEIERREDWREREVFTIDPEDAKDFDDAISVTENEDGTFELAVHIADVSHYVKSGSELDKEARKRGNSVYLADRVIPMLPEKLSNGICSLKPDVERLTHAAIMTFDAAGKMTASRFASCIIRSHCRYSYEEAFAVMMLTDEVIAKLESEKDQSLGRHLKRAWKLASMIREQRFQNGALDLDFPEVRVVLDDRGRAVGVKKSIYDESHQLIEEFMLSANEAVARETKNEPAPSIYRIHEDPDIAKLEEFAELARSFGHRAGDVTHRPELQKLLAAVKGKLEEHSVKLALLKSLRRAAYSTDPLGHYGLSKVNYTHFTSPIRRYADLVVHRVLRKILSRRHEETAPEIPDKTPIIQEMSDIAEHISKTERVAADAEKETQQLKLIEYLERVCAEDPDVSFDATVTDVRAIGAFVELNELLVKGLLRREDLPSREEYFFDRPRKQFKSRRNGPTLTVGQRVDVRLHRVDRIRGFIDFVLS
ncbi:MAG: ribonuclease R [Verrucomicrobiales bacterium]|nr:ribonuclease R [Verrucomicrobiales bacterium]